MNPLPPNADELVSAYLDGEAAPDEITLVESNPDLLARVESMRALTQPLSEPVTPSQSKEAHLSAALGLFDELFATDTGSSTAPTAEQPRLAAVSDPPESVPPATPKPDTASATPGEASDNVASFAQAQERRRRRVSPTVIAAAVAAVALLLFAVLSTGGRDNEVATTVSAPESSDAASANESTDDVVSGDEDDAMDEETAMEDDSAESRGGLSEADVPQAAPAAGNAASDADEDEPAEAGGEAMDEEAAMEDESQAMDDSEAMDEEEAEVEADSEADVLPEPSAIPADRVERGELYAFGDVSDPPLLQEQLDELAIDDLRLWASGDLEGLFPRCRFELDELPDDEFSLIGEGLVDEMPVEVHLVETQRDRRIFVVAADKCRVVFDFSLGS